MGRESRQKMGKSGTPFTPPMRVAKLDDHDDSEVDPNWTREWETE